MIDRDAFARALSGALELFALKPQGLARFEQTVSGFWQSFQAAIFVAPPYFIAMLLQPERGLDAGLSGGALWVSGIIGFVCGWLIFPLLALVLCRYFDLSARYVPLIIASNWTAVPQMLVLFVALIVSLALPDGLAAILLMMATVWVMYVQWFVIRTALGTNGPTALAFLFLDLILNQTLQSVVDAGFAG